MLDAVASLKGAEISTEDNGETIVVKEMVATWSHLAKNCTWVMLVLLPDFDYCSFISGQITS